MTELKKRQSINERAKKNSYNEWKYIFDEPNLGQAFYFCRFGEWGGRVSMGDLCECEDARHITSRPTSDQKDIFSLVELLLVASTNFQRIPFNRHLKKLQKNFLFYYISMTNSNPPPLPHTSYTFLLSFYLLLSIKVTN